MVISLLEFCRLFLIKIIKPKTSSFISSKIYTYIYTVNDTKSMAKALRHFKVGPVLWNWFKFSYFPSFLDICAVLYQLHSEYPIFTFLRYLFPLQVYPAIHCLFIYLSVCLSICLSVYLSVCLSICLFIYLSVCLFLLVLSYLSYPVVGP